MAAFMGMAVNLGLIIPCIFVVAGAHADLQQATATWYGSPDGDGSEGGACGYGSLVKATPFASRVTAVSPDLFKGGEGCGECFQVMKCEEKGLCSDTAVNIVVTNECPGCSTNHFDLSGIAFSGMAVTPAKASALRNVGVLPILFKRVPCKYHGKKIMFHVNEGSTDHWFSMLIEYEDGDGDLRESNSRVWEGLKQTWGANWAIDEGPLKAPFSIRLKTLTSGSTLTAYNVIPRNWKPNAGYTLMGDYD